MLHSPVDGPELHKKEKGTNKLSPFPGKEKGREYRRIRAASPHIRVRHRSRGRPFAGSGRGDLR